MSGAETIAAAPPKPRLGHRLEALLVRAGLALFRALPPAAASNLGGGAARAIGPLIPVSKVADKNLQAALPEMDAAGRKRTIAEVWENLGRTVAELAHIGALKETASGPGYRISGWEHAQAAMGKGGPSLILTGHIGNWEIIPPAMYGRGIDLAFMYRAASNRLVDDMILALREANFGRKVTMFPKGGAGARAAYAHLMRKGHLGMLNDQKLDNGIAVPFFGRDAMTAPALASFALKFRCPIIPVHVVREGPARLHVICEPPLTLPESGDKQADVLALTTETNRILERWIREKPGSWLWLHRRWPKN
jgi:KDO2-lipid IV(A) lauroyltransferase